VNPNLPEALLSFLGELILEIRDLDRETLVEILEVFPKVLMLRVGQVGQVCFIERFEVMKECLHDVLIEIVVREELSHRHEYWVAAFIRKKS